MKEQPPGIAAAAARGAAEEVKQEEEEEEEEDVISSTSPKMNSISSPSSIPEVHAVREITKSHSVVANVTVDNYEAVATAAATATASTLPSAALAHHQQHDRHRRPALISVSVYKLSRNTILGISFLSNAQGKLQIKNISSTGLLSTICNNGKNNSNKRYLQSGDLILTINNIYCSRWNPKHVIQHLQMLSGMITIVISPPVPTSTSSSSSPLKSIKAPYHNNSNDHDEEIAIINPTISNTTETEIVEIDSSLIQVIVYKMNVTDRLGISFYTEYDRLRIKSINSNGLVGGEENSILSVGDYVLSINDIDCMGIHDPNIARDIITTTPSRSCVSLIVISPTTNNNSSNMMTTTAGNPPPLLSTRHILFELSTSIRSMDQNDNDEEEDPVIAMARAISSRRTTSSHNRSSELLHHETNTMNPFHIHPMYYSISIIKPTITTNIGIEFQQDIYGSIIISKIIPGSIIATTTTCSKKSPSSSSSSSSSLVLKVGFVILSINNHPCTTLQKTYDALNDAEGQVVLVIQDKISELSNPNYVYAIATKFDPRSSIGIGLKSVHGSLTISTIKSTGLFASSVLNHDDIVLLINNIPSRHLSSSEAVSLVKKESYDTVSILVRTSSSTGIVLVSQQQQNGQNGLSTINDNEVQQRRERLRRQQELEQREKNQHMVSFLFFFALIIIVSIIIVATREQEEDDDYYYYQFEDDYWK